MENRVYGLKFGFIKNKKYKDIDICDCIFLRDFIYFDLNKENYPITVRLENFSLFNECEIIELNFLNYILILMEHMLINIMQMIVLSF